MRKTALYDAHIRLGAKMVEFAGYTMPIQYSGIRHEHEMVRERAGLFDVSHMGEVVARGEKAFGFVQHIFTNDFSDMQVGDVRYSPMCYADGGTVDDVLIYKKSEEEYLLVVNAANKEKDFSWMNKNNGFGIQLEDQSDATALLALQGPKAEAIAGQVFSQLPKGYYSFIETLLPDGTKAILSRTGYTGEDGFEIFCEAKSALALWDALLDIGGEDILPCGLGARDTLRLECAMPLYGQEMDKSVSPIEAGLNRFIKLDKTDAFIGQDSLIKQKEAGAHRRRAGIVLTDKGIARHEDVVWLDGEKIGVVTSGTKSITLAESIALVLLDRPLAVGTEVEIEVRGKRLKAKTVKLPFYKREK
ncbi:MAG: glycine cleavage system aminomethyltransferase GcvT [Eubacteriales bacterium]